MNKPEHIRYQITVRGRVQGVFFRDSTQQEAKRLGIAGTVRNRPDGSVYIEAEGTPKQLGKLLTWVREGPTHAQVESVDVATSPAKGRQGFTILT